MIDYFVLAMAGVGLIAAPTVAMLITTGKVNLSESALAKGYVVATSIVFWIECLQKFL